MPLAFLSHNTHSNHATLISAYPLQQLSHYSCTIHHSFLSCNTQLMPLTFLSHNTHRKHATQISTYALQHLSHYSCIILPHQSLISCNTLPTRNTHPNTCLLLVTYPRLVTEPGNITFKVFSVTVFLPNCAIPEEIQWEISRSRGIDISYYRHSFFSIFGDGVIYLFILFLVHILGYFRGGYFWYENWFYEDIACNCPLGKLHANAKVNLMLFQSL